MEFNLVDNKPELLFQSFTDIKTFLNINDIELINNAIKSRNFEYFIYIIKSIDNIHLDLNNILTENGNIKYLKYMIAIGYKLNKKTLECAVHNNNLKCVIFLETLDFKIGINEANISALKGYCEILEYCLENGIKPESFYNYSIVTNCDLDCIKLLDKYKVKINYNKDIIKIILQKNRIEIFKFITQNRKGNYSSFLCIALKNKNLELLKLLHELGSTLSNITMRIAMKHGFLDGVIYLHENGILWEENFYENLLIDIDSYINIELHEYYKYGFDWKKTSYFNLINCIKYAVNNGLILDKDKININDKIYKYIFN